MGFWESVDWGDVASAVGGYISATQQAGAIQQAGKQQQQATQAGMEAQKGMWTQMYSDFAPYLQAGYSGLEQLTTMTPQYLQQTVAPAYNQFMQYGLTELPQPGQYYVNPVTGEVGAPQNVMGTGAMTGGGVLAPEVPTVYQGLGYTGQQPEVPTIGRELGYTGQMPEIPGMEYTLPEGAGAMPEVPGLDRSLEGFTLDTNDPYYQTRLRQKNAEIDQFLTKQGLQGSTAGESYRQKELDTFNAAEYDRQYGRAYAEREYARTGDIQRYNMQMQQAETGYGRALGERAYQTEADIARYGMQTGQEQTGYGRAVAEREYQTGAGLQQYGLGTEREREAYQRALTERGYGTEAALQQYGLEAGRGETLYNRLAGGLGTLYGQQFQTAQAQDQANLNLLAQRYGLATDVYNKLYGQALDLTKIGQGAAGTTGQGALSTGAGLAQGYQNLGAGQAAATMAGSQNWANYINSLGSYFG